MDHAVAKTSADVVGASPVFGPQINSGFSAPTDDELRAVGFDLVVKGVEYYGSNVCCVINPSTTLVPFLSSLRQHREMFERHEARVEAFKREQRDSSEAARLEETIADFVAARDGKGQPTKPELDARRRRAELPFTHAKALVASDVFKEYESSQRAYELRRDICWRDMPPHVVWMAKARVCDIVMPYVADDSRDAVLRDVMSQGVALLCGDLEYWRVLAV